ITDGRQGLQRLIAAGEHEILDATNEVTLLLGDSAACSFSINGVVAHHPGKPGQPATLHITRQNYRDFLNSGPAANVSGASPMAPGPSAAASIPSGSGPTSGNQ